MPDGSCWDSDTQIIRSHHKTHEILPSITIYINTINNRLVFKIKDGYKLESQTPETMNLFSSTTKLIEKTKNGERPESWSRWSSFSLI